MALSEAGDAVCSLAAKRASPSVTSPSAAMAADDDARCARGELGRG
jgi:hypothetical protein